MWQVGDIAVVIKDASHIMTPGIVTKKGTVFRVDEVEALIDVVGLRASYMWYGNAKYGLDSRVCRKIHKADDKFCEQMKQLMKGKIDA